MPKQLALFICVIFILWLFSRDRKFRPMTSWALWVVFLWLIIIGSRPVSLWFNLGVTLDSVDVYLEGSPLDRNVFILLIVTGLVVLFRREVNWSVIFYTNRWLFLFVAYCGISFIWSDYPLVSLKRWIKDIGNIVMILIIFTETDIVQATKAIFSRYTSLVIPLSVVFNKYFPEFGRHYNRWSGEPYYSGITTTKNSLGILFVFCGLYLGWELIEMRTPNEGETDKTDLFGRVVLSTMLLWQLFIAQSATAIVSLMIGIGILVFMRMPFFKRQVEYLGMYSLGVILLIIFYYSFFLKTVTEVLGRDDTLTGRTFLWADVLSVPINPLIGTGFKSFWLGPRLHRLSELYYWQPVQAHNGYLETYLNLGWIGVCLLIGMIISTGIKLKKELILGSNYGILLFSFLVVAIFHNVTEASFNALSLTWFILLTAALYYPPSKDQFILPQDEL